jgi:hypothetical protein
MGDVNNVECEYVYMCVADLIFMHLKKQNIVFFKSLFEIVFEVLKLESVGDLPPSHIMQTF